MFELRIWDTGNLCNFPYLPWAILTKTLVLGNCSLEDLLVHAGSKIKTQQPCIVRLTPKGSISSQILAETLQHMDSLNIFNRGSGRYSFLLLDLHQSQFKMSFLEYTTNKNHEWRVIMQVANSKERNGSYKIALARSK